MERERESRKKYNIQGDIKTLLGRDFEVTKEMRFVININKINMTGAMSHSK